MLPTSLRSMTRNGIHYREVRMRFYFLTTREQRLIEKTALHVLPERPKDPQIFMRKLLYHIDRFLMQLGPALRFLFHVGAFGFSALAGIYARYPASFSNLSSAQQKRWVDRVARTRFLPLYRWFNVLRGLILLVYYSQEETHIAMGYYPREWAKEKIMQRRRRLKLSEESENDHYPRTPLRQTK